MNVREEGSHHDEVAMCLLLMTATAAPSASAAPIDDLIAAAKKEGAVEFFAARTLGAEGAQTLGEAFNRCGLIPHSLLRYSGLHEPLYP